jgi:hypothetical protein
VSGEGKRKRTEIRKRIHRRGTEDAEVARRIQRNVGARRVKRFGGRGGEKLVGEGEVDERQGQTW